MREKATALALSTIIGLITLAIVIGFLWTTLGGVKQ
jgi:hypothetical protein